MKLKQRNDIDTAVCEARDLFQLALRHFIFWCNQLTETEYASVNWAIISLDNDVSPRRQVILLTNASILLIWVFVTNFNETMLAIKTFSLRKMHFKMPSSKLWLVGLACRRCSNYIFILNLTPAFNGRSEDNCKRIQETSKFWDLVRLIL